MLLLLLLLFERCRWKLGLIWLQNHGAARRSLRRWSPWDPRGYTVSRSVPYSEIFVFDFFFFNHLMIRVWFSDGRGDTRGIDQ